MKEILSIKGTTDSKDDVELQIVRYEDSHHTRDRVDIIIDGEIVFQTNIDKANYDSFFRLCKLIVDRWDNRRKDDKKTDNSISRRSFQKGQI